MLKYISKIVGILFSITIISPIVVSMGWHTHPIAKHTLNAGKKTYNQVAGVVGAKKLALDNKSKFQVWLNELGGKLIESLTIDTLKYVLIFIFGVLFHKFVKS